MYNSYPRVLPWQTMMNGWGPERMMGGWGGFGILGFAAPFIAAFVMLDLVLKGFALWRAGRHNQPYWFVALLLLNTLGILPAIYLIFFQKKTTARTSNSR